MGQESAVPSKAETSETFRKKGKKGGGGVGVGGI